jgi:hypothetical protein
LPNASVTSGIAVRSVHLARVFGAAFLLHGGLRGKAMSRTIQVACSHCGKPLVVNASLAGMPIRCRACKQPSEVREVNDGKGLLLTLLIAIGAMVLLGVGIGIGLLVLGGSKQPEKASQQMASLAVNESAKEIAALKAQNAEIQARLEKMEKLQRQEQQAKAQLPAVKEKAAPIVPKRDAVVQFQNVEMVYPWEFKVGQRGPIVPNPSSLGGGLGPGIRFSSNMPSNRFIIGGPVAERLERQRPPDYWFEVDAVLSDNEVRIREHLVAEHRTPIKFILEMPTKGLADDGKIQLTGVVDVIGTKRTETGTFFVLRPAPEAFQNQEKGKRDELFLDPEKAKQDELDRDQEQARKRRDERRQRAEAKRREQEEANKRAAEERKKPENVQAAAASKLKLIKTLIENGKMEMVQQRLEQLIKAYPNTAAAREARTLLDSLDK